MIEMKIEIPFAVNGRFGFGDEVIKPLFEEFGERSSSRFGFFAASDVSSSSSSRQNIFLKEWRGDVKSLLGLRLVA
jgi:hypothetical protein